MLVLAFGRATQMLIMFATYRLLSTFFSTEEMSTYYFLLSIAGFFGLIVANPLGMYLNRIIHRAKKEDLVNAVVTTFAKLMVALTLIVVPVVLMAQSKISDRSFSILIIGFMLLAYVVGTTINGTFVSILNILAINNAFVVLTILTSLIGLMTSIFFVKFINHDPIFWLLGQSVALIIFGLIALFFIKRHGPSNTNSYKINKKEVMAFAIPILVTNIFVWIMSQSFRFFLKGSINDAVLGEMAFGLGLATALAVAVEYLFQQLLFPDFYSALNDTKADREKSWNKLFSKSAPAYICLVVYMSTLSPFIINVLADGKFQNATKFFALGSVYEFFRMLGNMNNMAFQSEMKTKKAILPYAVGGLLTISGIVYISFNPEFISYTPHVLIAGQYVIFQSLLTNQRKMMTIVFPGKQIFKSILMSLPFLLSLYVVPYKNLMVSIATCGVFGVYLLFLFYKIQKDDVV